MPVPPATPVPRLDVVTIGEGQLRLTTPTGESLGSAQELRLDVAGTEGNVMGLLAQLGSGTGLITALPDNPVGRRVAAEYARVGIDLSRTVWRDDGRVALYFLEQGSPPVPSRVLYDRAHSCFTALTPADIDWEYVGQARMLHTTGISAALGPGPSSILRQATETAASNGQLRSVDVNHRSLLWTAQTARSHLGPLLDGADVIFCSRRDAATVFGVVGETPAVGHALAQRFHARTVVVSDGADPVVVWNEGDILTAVPPATSIVNRVGAGDAFVGGFLCGFLDGDPGGGLRLGIAAAALVLTRRADMLNTTRAELVRLSDSFDLGTDIVR